MKSQIEPWPLESWFRLAVLHLQIRPEDFWNLPLRDWLWLLRKAEMPRLTIEKFEDLMAQYPDKNER